MNANTAANLIRAFAINAEIEGMKARNAERADRGEAQAYGSDAFFECAQRLEELARDTLQWG